MRHNEKEANILLSEIHKVQGSSILIFIHVAYFDCCNQNKPSVNVEIIKNKTWTN